MKVVLTENFCEVIREKDDPKIYGNLNAAGESKLLYKIKQELIKQGHKVIKKRMCKDGHLVSDMQQYIRTAIGYKPSFCIYNRNFNVIHANNSYNEGFVVLKLDRNIY
jgi:hypothetical protein